MYYIDSNTGTIDAFDYDIETAAISNRRIAATNLWGGYFDGMTIDSEDNLYVAVWQGGAVRKINSRTGKLLATITVPGVKNITSCAFGGENLDELYITSSAHNADLKDEPNAGALFKLKLTDSHGVPAFEFKG
jgi:sugar lactone lactonase YvrE